MKTYERQNQIASLKGGRVYNIAPRLTRHTKLTPLGDAFHESFIFCRSHDEGRHGRGGKRDAQGNTYCAQCVSQVRA